ncbi:hypothetical protein [Actinomadura madurae]|uniref:hypothetical protein n=1 Tax=Actinomadura madurae TaxID=1993 RepID=UPI0020D214A3|nr:hypothetical protein [Actinomadura madurae]MCP9967813.1 hypothetical protein [Actinomadura madurae]MCP9980270.1 hypothetical protein [Actinomadura madurae]MCQ0016479.1 hypothetical protein [Actinomadura madurae]
MTGDDLPATVWGPSDMSRGAADRRRLAASFDLMAAVLNGTTLPSLLKLVTERARSMAGVPLAFIALPAEEAHTLRVDVAVGVGSDRIRGLTVRRGRSMLGRAFTSRRALSARIVTDQTLSALPGRADPDPAAGQRRGHPRSPRRPRTAERRAVQSLHRTPATAVRRHRRPPGPTLRGPAHDRPARQRVRTHHRPPPPTHANMTRPGGNQGA